MSGKTEIEWATDVWNPTAGCDRVSPGCDHCYAMTMAKRLKGMGQEKYQLDGDPRTSGPGFLAHEWPQALDWPLTVKKPMRVFVNSMSDLFHDNISNDFIVRVFAVMALAPQHTFQVLTKRHARMRSLLSDDLFWARVAVTISDTPEFATYDWSHLDRARPSWRPLPNVWLGVSVENQQWANIRISALLATPAAVRFLSCEPLLGPVDLYLSREAGMPDWVIAGGESGPGARPMHPDWARSLRDQCVAAGVPFLFKQWGEWQDGSADRRTQRGDDHIIVIDGRHEPAIRHQDPDLPYTPLASDRVSHRPGTNRAVFISRVGKKSAGRELDGRTWDEYPERSA